MWKFLKRHLEVDERLSELEERFEKLERRLTQCDLDWDELYDKCRHLMGRVAKRTALEAPEAPESLEPAPSNGLSIPRTHAGMLTDRQKTLQQQILRRRGGGG